MTLPKSSKKHQTTYAVLILLILVFSVLGIRELGKNSTERNNKEESLDDDTVIKINTDADAGWTMRMNAMKTRPFRFDGVDDIRGRSIKEGF